MDFQQDVIALSHEVPVVVDFWAPWCGPCRVLGPVIEELASESNGKWKLVKVNTEEATDIAQAYHIRSIPNVKLFSAGKVVAEFAGALPKFQIQQWLKDHLPSDDSKAWAQLADQLETLPADEQMRELEAFVKLHPDHLPAKSALAKKLAFNDPVQAEVLLADVKMADDAYDTLQDIQTIGELYTVGEGRNVEAEKLLKQAALHLSKNDLEAAAKSIIDSVSKDKGVFDELPRRAGVAMFRLLGDQHPVTKKHRRTFDMWLY